MAGAPWEDFKQKDEPGPWVDYQAPKRRTPMEMLGRGAALTGRGLVEGVAGIPLMVTDAPTVVKRALGYKTGQTGAEALHAAMSKISPEPETRAEKIAQFGGEIVPAAFTGASAVGPRVGVALKDVGRSLMASATKPTLSSWKSGDAATAIETLLQKGINATEGGVRKLRTQIDALNDQIGSAIANSTANVDKAKAGRYLNDLMAKFKNQVNPEADTSAIRKAWDEFKNHPVFGGGQEMSVQSAQELKRGTYQQLRKKYGQMGTADVEAQKALGRGLKDEISAMVPDVAKLNAEEARLIKTLNVTERRALMDLNKNPLGLGLLTHNPSSFAAFMADKSALFKSIVARMAYGGSTPLGGVAGGTGGVSLYELNKMTERQ